jgi:uncharacterized protein (DUF1778 family)
MPLTFWCQNGAKSSMEHTLDVPRKRITSRVSGNLRPTLEQAAELLGSTVKELPVQMAYQGAQRILECQSVIRLSQRDAREILALLD